MVSFKEERMREKIKKTMPKVVGAIGIILIVATGFDLIPRYDNLMLFIGVALLIAGGTIKKILTD